mmetsp:Transcript_6079/g.5425  ORF Transcript_6079/g.5425 Transcript_6079/m.5425 type:complete len:96 (+) Transcript_6079:60-347(+)
MSFFNMSFHQEDSNNNDPDLIFCNQGSNIIDDFYPLSFKKSKKNPEFLFEDPQIPLTNKTMNIVHTLPSKQSNSEHLLAKLNSLEFVNITSDIFP